MARAYEEAVIAFENARCNLEIVGFRERFTARIMDAVISRLARKCAWHVARASERS